MSTPIDALRRIDVPGATRPRASLLTVVLSVAAGIALAVLWSFELVDKEIGDNVANTLLGHDAKQTVIAGTAAGLLFAFVSGLAGTFTACNIAVAAAVGPLTSAGAADRPGRPTGVMRALLRPTAYLVAGMTAVSAAYGFIGVLLGSSLPQLSTDTVNGMPVRIVQSSVVFGLIGLALVYLGLAALGVLPDLFARRPTARVVVLGALIGGFLIGRPYPLFNKLFHYAAETDNPLFGAAAFVLQSLGNVTIVLVLFAALTLLTRGRFVTWLAGSPPRAALVSGVLLLALGVFTVVYWDLRVPSLFGIGWFPEMPYNS